MDQHRYGSGLLLCFTILSVAAIQASAFVAIPSPLPARRVSSTATSPSTSSRTDYVGRIGRRRPRRCCTVAKSAAPPASPPNGGGSSVTPQAEAAARPEAVGSGAVEPGTSHDDAQGPDASTDRHTSSPMTPAISEVREVPSYRRLYDSAMRLLESELKLEPYPIPEGLEGNRAVVGKGKNQQTVKTSITAFRSSKFRQIRAALVETDGPTQVLNLVMFPNPSYDLPIFGADLVSLPGVHLVCIDLQPAHPSQKRDENFDSALSETQRRHLDGLPWGGDLPPAAQKFFSPQCLWSKLGAKEPVEQKALDAMMDYLRDYLRLVETAEPLEGDGPLEVIAAGHADYSNYRRENDPARGMLTRFYGSEWTEAAIEGILFDFNLTPTSSRE